MKKELGFIKTEAGYVCKKCNIVKHYTDSYGYINHYCNNCGNKLNWESVNNEKCIC
jgi:hypothetical protein